MCQRGRINSTSISSLLSQRVFWTTCAMTSFILQRKATEKVFCQKDSICQSWLEANKQKFLPSFPSAISELELMPPGGISEKFFLSHPLEELLGTDPGPGVDAELHLRDLLVDLLHEVDDEVDQLVPEHLLGVEVGDQETDVVALEEDKSKMVLGSKK